MSEIKTMTELRTKLLKAFQQLEDGEIDIAQAAALAKLSETINSGLKSEMQYAILTNSEPSIPFFGANSGKLLGADIKKLP